MIIRQRGYKSKRLDQKHRKQVILDANNASSGRLLNHLFCGNSVSRLIKFLSLQLSITVYISCFNISKNTQCTVHQSFQVKEEGFRTICFSTSLPLAAISLSCVLFQFVSWFPYFFPFFQNCHFLNKLWSLFWNFSRKIINRENTALFF